MDNMLKTITFIVYFFLSCLVQGCCIGLTSSHYYTCREISLSDIQFFESEEEIRPYHKILK